jgi:AcrR family transcriptional regulator
MPQPRAPIPTHARQRARPELPEQERPTGPPHESPKARRRYAPRMPPAQRREQLIDAALEVILEHGYGGVSIEAVARAAGVTRPVVYDHFPDLPRLLHALVEREERYSLEQLEEVVPQVSGDPGGRQPVEVLASSVRRFLDAVMERPATWRLILLPLEGTPAIVREHVEVNRARMLRRIEALVQRSIDFGQLPNGLDAELAARAIRDLGEEAGRTVLTDPKRFTPDRYERFVQSVLGLIWAGSGNATRRQLPA